MTEQQLISALGWAGEDWECSRSDTKRVMWETPDGEQTKHYRRDSVLKPCRDCIDKALSLKIHDGLASLTQVEERPKRTRLQEAAVCALISMLGEFPETKERRWMVSDEWFQNVIELHDSLVAEGVITDEDFYDDVYPVADWILGDG